MPRRKLSSAEDKLIPTSTYLTKDLKTALQKYVAKNRKTEAEFIRESIEKNLQIQSYKDDINFIQKIIRETVSDIIRPEINRMIAIEQKSIKSSATATYMLAHFMYDYVPPEMQRDMKQTLFRCNEMGKEYSSKRANESGVGVLDNLKIDDEEILDEEISIEEIEGKIKRYKELLEIKKNRRK